jgi:hypothetical protein
MAQESGVQQAASKNLPKDPAINLMYNNLSYK